jgi:hypothetical protein
MQKCLTFVIHSNKFTFYISIMESSHSPDTEFAAPRRNTFLTVLCILTFIFSGVSLVNNISTYMNADVSSTFMEQTVDNAQQEVEKKLGSENDSLTNKVMTDIRDISDPESLKKSALFSIVSYIMTLTGAFLMFRLQKIGFWIYLAGTIVWVIGPIATGGLNNLMSQALTVIMAVTGFVFVILYAVNLRYMK